MHAEIIQRFNLSKEDIQNKGWTSLIDTFTEIQFEDMVLVTFHFFPTAEAGTLIVKYCMETKNKAHLKDALEFMSLYGFEDEGQALFEVYQDDEELALYVSVYRLAYEARRKTASHLEVIERVDQLYGQADDNALLLKLDLIKLYELTVNKKPIVVSIYDELIAKLRTLETSYLKTSLLTRLLSLYSYSLFYHDERIEEAEASCIANIVNPVAPPIFKASAQHILGLIYTFTNIESSLQALKEAVKLYQDTGYDKAAQSIENNDIPFALNINNQPLEDHVDLNLVDKDELAHYYLLQFNFKEAKTILDEIIQQNPNHFIARLYLAYAERDRGALSELALNCNAYEKRLIRHFSKKMI